MTFDFIAGLISTTFCLTVMTFTSKTTSIVLLIIGVGSLGLAMTGFLCNMVDVAPRYLYVVMGNRSGSERGGGDG